MEDHTTTDRTLEALRALRQDFPWVGAVLQSYLHRTEADCRDLADEGSRVRLCKGAYKEPESVAFQDGDDVDLSYVRCLKVLMAGEGYPMVASHDPRLIDIAAGPRRPPRPLRRTATSSRCCYGIRPEEQTRIADRGHQMRVYVPFGEEWYGYLMRRMAERPANLHVLPALARHHRLTDRHGRSRGGRPPKRRERGRTRHTHVPWERLRSSVPASWARPSSRGCSAPAAPPTSSSSPSAGPTAPPSSPRSTACG